MRRIPKKYFIDGESVTFRYKDKIINDAQIVLSTHKDYNIVQDDFRTDLLFPNRDKFIHGLLLFKDGIDGDYYECNEIVINTIGTKNFDIGNISVGDVVHADVGSMHIQREVMSTDCNGTILLSEDIAKKEEIKFLDTSFVSAHIGNTGVLENSKIMANIQTLEGYGFYTIKKPEKILISLDEIAEKFGYTKDQFLVCDKKL